MPFLFQYLLKLSVSFAAVYLFYQLFLRRLTFYNWNRWYLLTYSLLSFAIPFLNLNLFVEPAALEEIMIVRNVPVLEKLTPRAIPQAYQTATGYDSWSIVTYLLLTGVTVFLLRLLFQYTSLLRLKSRASLLEDGDIKLYHLEQDIAPFSFGKNIFINITRHTEAEMQDIIHHEFVHVKQRHSADILFGEFLCMLNWYNPFVWLIKHAIRQNLEFIADGKVLEKGVDKKQYQYLLLKVMGNSQFSIANKFNFSSLKKRIIMMNKLKSAKVHLLKFLFLLPVISVTLLAFRGKIIDKNNTVTIAGIVTDAATMQPIQDAVISTTLSNTTTNSDKNGYYQLEIAVDKYPLQFDFSINKEGFQLNKTGLGFSRESSSSSVVMVGLTKQSNSEQGFVHAYPSNGEETLSYNSVEKRFTELVVTQQHARKLQQLMAGNEQVYFDIDGEKYIIGSTGNSSSLSTSSVEIYLNDKKITPADLNNQYKRSQIISISASSKDETGIFYLKTMAANATTSVKTSASESDSLYEDWKLKDIILEVKNAVANIEDGISEAKGEVSITIKPTARGMIIYQGKQLDAATFERMITSTSKFNKVTIYQQRAAFEHFGKQGRYGVLVIDAPDNFKFNPAKEITVTTDSLYFTDYQARQDSTVKYITTEEFYKLHPEIDIIIVSKKNKAGQQPKLASLEIVFKNKRKELYDLQKPEDIKKAMLKYGQLPLLEDNTPKDGKPEATAGLPAYPVINDFAPVKEFGKQHPEVVAYTPEYDASEKKVTAITFFLQNNKKERYDLTDPVQVKNANHKYGPLPLVTFSPVKEKDVDLTRLPADYKAFLERNPGVRSLMWRNNPAPRIIIEKKDWKGYESYQLNNPKEIEKMERKYGKLPAPHNAV